MNLDTARQIGVGTVWKCELGTHCGVLPKAVTRVLDAVVKAAPTWIERLGELPFDPRTVHKLRKACSYRIQRLSN